MPTWEIHLAVAKKLNNNLNLNKNIFYIANLMPDIPLGYIIKDISYPFNRSITHFNNLSYTNNKITKIDINGFYNTYHSKFNNPVILGYYIHLLTDYYWNTKTYSEHGLYDKDNNRIGLKLNTGKDFLCDKETSRIIKTNDFKLFSNYLYKNNMIEKIDFDNKITSFLKDMTWLKIDINDIKKAISYINDICDGKIKILSDNEKDYYQIFTEKDMIKEFDMCIKYIFKNLNK